MQWINCVTHTEQSDIFYCAFKRG